MAWGYNPGVHWRDYERTNPELFWLAFERAEKFYPELVDPYREAPREIEVTFGSRRSSVILQHVNWEAIQLFGWGYCTLLALALHDLYGFQLVLLTKSAFEKSWNGHAVVEIENGRYLDINGIHEGHEEILAEYRFHCEPQRVTREEFCSIVVTDEEFQKEPFEFVDKLEMLITYDFAEHLARKYELL